MDPAPRPGRISDVDCSEGGSSCRSFELAWTWQSTCLRFMALTDRGMLSFAKPYVEDPVSTFFANLAPCLVGVEASNGAHYWARVLTELGHKVRLISPQFVAPYVKTNKNDRNDAEAICEAVGRPAMRFVPPKSPEQLAGQALHRIRQRLVRSRTKLVNQIRGILAEHGIVIARDIWRLRRALAEITGHVPDDLNTLVRVLIFEGQDELLVLDRRIASCDRRIRELYRRAVPKAWGNRRHRTGDRY